jgi:surfactin synthase thioesterase subunit
MRKLARGRMLFAFRFRVTPDAILDYQELMLLRSDFRLCEEYEMHEPRFLQASLSVMSGEQDEKTPETEMLLWKRAIRGAFESRRYPGGHFFFTDPLVTWNVFDSLRGWQGRQRMSEAGASIHRA